ncbi:uncharacterized protein [Henckelia pumila]|uniref:uncharacterized protein isoform X2 n=1 Tax=Henckelia pumila TaxID=405737 RepID=UPI003C6DBAFB
MGKKKKFIDKKKSATFHLLSRDTSDPNYTSDTSGDRVFVRVDNNGYPLDTLDGDGVPKDEVSLRNPNSIFADATEDCGGDCEDGNYDSRGSRNHKEHSAALPDHVRKEILELGFPDDGYDYLIHLREIKNRGGGSTYYDNPKASSTQLPRDVKAYDSSRVEVHKINDVSVEKSIYGVAAKTIGVRLQKVLDADVAAMLDDSDSSKFGSDVEDLEEDFVVIANLLEGAGDDDIDAQLNPAGGLMADHMESGNLGVPENVDSNSGVVDEKPRIRRPLDEQFDLLELEEYASDNEEHGDYSDEEEEFQESLVEKLNFAFKDHPSDLLHGAKGIDDVESPESTADVIRRCKEYAVEYEGENENKREEIFVESSDESEVWDCESILSTYSTLDNHPGKIGAPEARRKKRLDETIFGASNTQVIALKGKEKIPVDYLPHGRKHVEQKSNDEKDANSNRAALQKRKPHGQESKEEKKERKFFCRLL